MVCTSSEFNITMILLIDLLFYLCVSMFLNPFLSKQSVLLIKMVSTKQDLNVNFRPLQCTVISVSIPMC